MALKAGYYGIKKKMVKKLTNLTGIYSLGQGLSLSSAGALSCKNATTSQKGIVQLDASPTDNSSNPVTSDGVYEADKNIYGVMGSNGAKNLLPLTLNSIKALNISNWTWNGNVGSNNGVDFTISTDINGYVTKIRANGTATGGNANLHIINNKSYGDIILNGCPSGGSLSDYYIRSAVGSEYPSDVGNGVEITGTILDSWIGIALNKQVTNLDFYPMIRLATDTDSTFQPYAQTNRQLTTSKANASALGTVENDTTASKSYAVREHFSRFGDFCTVTQPIASGGTLTEGTNYIVGDVAGNIPNYKFIDNNASVNININLMNIIIIRYGSSEGDGVIYAVTATVAVKISGTTNEHITLSVSNGVLTISNVIGWGVGIIII